MKILLFRALLLLMLLAVVPGSAGAAEGPAAAGYSVDTVLVGYDPSTSSADLRRLAMSMNGVLVKVIPEIGVAQVRVRSGAAGLALERARGLSGVAYAEPEMEFRALGLPAASTVSSNDPRRGLQWYVGKVQANQAWTISKGNSRFPIAIVDTGVDTGHPDLAGRVVGGRNFLPGADPTNYMDDNGHGTHVAGVAAAASNNAVGVVGLTWSTPIYAVKALDYFGYGEESVIAQAIVWSANHGAKVINLSFGTSAPSTSTNVSTLKRAVDYAVNQGALVVAASGNAGAGRLEYPAAFANVLSVGATDQYDRRAPFSNYGSGLDISAPGMSIYSTTSRSRNAYLISSSQTTPTYGYLDGTSMAAPVVAAIAAAVWAHMPTRSGSQIIARLTSTARDIGTRGYDNATGWGRIDFLNAVQLYSSVRGHVYAPSGEPVAGATVTLGNTTRTTITDSTGYYRFFRVTQGYRTPTVMVPGVGLARSGVSMSDGVAYTRDLRLVARGSVRGSVRDSAGRGLAGATVALQGTTTTARTDRYGNFQLWAIASGTQRLTASLTGYYPSTVAVAVETGREKTAGFTLQRR